MYVGPARRLGQVVLPMTPVRLGQRRRRRRVRLGQEEDWFSAPSDTVDWSADEVDWSAIEAVTMPETVIPALDQSAWTFTGPTYSGSLESPAGAAAPVGTETSTDWFGNVASIFGKVLAIVPAVLPAVLPVLQQTGVLPSRTTTTTRAPAPPGYGYTSTGQVVKVPTGYTVNAAGQIIAAPSTPTWLWPVLLGGGALAGLAYMTMGRR